ncbi:DUF4190 domain-containing protein [Nocardioides currus]|uniref:Transporter n=1 Tax=Nocardioides currus TaxID=2133958 RepID=A0A2R7Z345_9ACTN|nr:DUF4190 domain-containing protein [Nocardioides currus]PUA82589.1 transporter [Nocardioides currus]
MTPPEPPSNPYDPNWPKPEQPAPTQPYGQEPSPAPDAPYAPYAPYGQPQPAAPSGQTDPSASQDQPPYGEPSSAPYGQTPYGQAPYGQAPYGQAPYGQAPYGQAPYGQVPYGQPAYGAPGYGGPMAASHPSATTAMVLGIGALGGMFVCGLPIVLAPFAWMIGGRAVKEIDANPGRYTGRDQAQAGRIMGMIGTALLALIVVGIIVFIGLAVAVSDTSSDFTYDSENGYSNSSF